MPASSSHAALVILPVQVGLTLSPTLPAFAPIKGAVFLLLVLTSAVSHPPSLFGKTHRCSSNSPPCQAGNLKIEDDWLPPLCSLVEMHGGLIIGMCGALFVARS